MTERRFPRLRLAPISDDRRRGRIALALWFAAAVAIAVFAWGFYDLAFDVDNCFLGTAHGGRADSPNWAALIGFFLFVPSVFFALRWRQRLLLLLLAFSLAYAGSLVALWVATPTIWRPARCTYQPL